MAAWKQILLSLVVVLLAGFLGLKLSPSAAGFMASHGFAGPLASLGLLPPVDPAGQPGGQTAGAQPATGARQGSGRSGPGSSRVTSVVLQPAGSAIINDKITALGTGAALQSVTVLPKSTGTLTEVLVHSGATVVAGQVIARLDSAVEKIARDKAKLAVDDAKRTLERNKALMQSNNVAATQTQAVELAAQLAVLNLRSAEQDLADRVISAPIDGVVGIVRVTIGNAVTAQTEIVTIEDSSSLVVNFWLPERLSGQVKVGDDASLVPVARPELTLAAKVWSIDNQIDPASGTFQVQARVANPDGGLQAGMAFTVGLQFTGQTYVTVDPLAVQWGSDGAYVWRLNDTKVEKVAVRIVQRNTESVLVAGEVKPGDRIVTEGLDGLKPGAEVQVFGADLTAATTKPDVAKPDAGKPEAGKASEADAGAGSAQAAEAPASGEPVTATDKPKQKQGGDAAAAGN
ncbi:MAG: efflux RND transporter periplasmic adaptor subunit [Cypionkella sp.]